MRYRHGLPGAEGFRDREGVTATVIAMDGIAVIVNNANPLADIATQTVQDIYTGAVLNWSDVIA